MPRKSKKPRKPKKQQHFSEPKVEALRLDPHSISIVTVQEVQPLPKYL